MLPIVADYPHASLTGIPEALSNLAIWSVARQVRDQLVDDPLTRHVGLDCVENRVEAMRVNGTEYEVVWDTDHEVLDGAGRPVMGVTEYDPATPGCALVSINGPALRGRDYLLRSTIAHEMGHLVFDAPGWMKAPSAMRASLLFEGAAMSARHDVREVRANEFMGGFLVPPALVRVDLARLSRQLRLERSAIGSRVIRGAPALDAWSMDEDVGRELIFTLAERYGVSASFMWVRLNRYDLVRQGQARHGGGWSMGFGPWIRRERTLRGIGLSQFANAIGISIAYWSRIERGLEKAPRDELILAACDQLGVSSDQAFIEARRLPPDMQDDIAVAVSVYRSFKTGAA